MLHPKETDLLGLFLVFVVLPIVAYILLGKWSEVSKKKDKIRVLAQIAAQESFRAECMIAAVDVPVVSVPKVVVNRFHECARCCNPATTRCARCKMVRYWYVSFNGLCFTFALNNASRTEHVCVRSLRKFLIFIM